MMILERMPSMLKWNTKAHSYDARIDILADINECSRKLSCGTVESVKNSLELAGKYDKRDIAKALAAAKYAGYF